MRDAKTKDEVKHVDDDEKKLNKIKPKLLHLLTNGPRSGMNHLLFVLQ